MRGIVTHEPVAAPQYARLLPRVKALVTDLAVYTAAIVLVVVVGSAIPNDLVVRVVVTGFIGGIVLYEPIMVWRFGGTIGHIRQNLRIVSDRTGGNPGLPASLLRWITKGVLGIISFFAVALTRRHQALHDTASATTVQIRDTSAARPGQFVTERTEPVGATDVSAARRLAVIVAYELLVFFVLLVPPVFLVSDACAFQDVCTDAENLTFSVLGLLWFGLGGAVVVLGWKGKLPGARSRAV